MSTNDDFWLDLLESGELQAMPDGTVYRRSTNRYLRGSKGRYRKFEYRDSEGRTRYTSVHRIIALAEHGPLPEGHTVNHIDGDRENNRPENLEVGPHSENIKHSFAMGLQPPIPKGEKHWLAKLTDEQVGMIRSSTKGCRALGRELGVSYSLISAIRLGNRRT